jgi:hypothetical protein
MYGFVSLFAHYPKIYIMLHDIILFIFIVQDFFHLYNFLFFKDNVLFHNWYDVFDVEIKYSTCIINYSTDIIGMFHLYQKNCS